MTAGLTQATGVLKEAFDRVLAYLPRFISAVGLVLAHPIRALTERAPAKGSLNDALVFWLIAQALTIALSFVAFNGDQEPAAFFAAALFSAGFTYASVSAGMFWAWRALGSAMRFSTVAAAVGYLWGSLGPVGSAVIVIGTGLLGASGPAIRDAIVMGFIGCLSISEVSEVVIREIGGLIGPLVALLFVVVIFGLTVLYGAYAICFMRALWILGGIGRTRSFIACGLCILALIVALTLSKAFYDSVMQGAARCAAPTP
jgi:hypothetical protein